MTVPVLEDRIALVAASEALTLSPDAPHGPAVINVP